MLKQLFIRFSFFFALTLLVGNTGLWAQQTAEETKAKPDYKIGVLTPKERAERVSKRMAHQYDLTATQQQQVVDIYMNANKQKREARKSSHKNKQTQKATFRGIQQELQQELRAMLNPQQRQKMDEQIAQRVAKKAERQAQTQSKRVKK